MDSKQSTGYVIDGHTVNRGDVLVFETDRGPVRVTVGSYEKRQFWKIVAGVNVYYTIFTALNVYVNGKEEADDDAIAVAHHEQLKKLLILDSSSNEKEPYRSRGIASERTVTGVTVEINTMARSA